jgi:hypothetical protein
VIYLDDKYKENKMTIYFTPEIRQAIEKVYKDRAKFGEKKHSIVVRCVIAGLKSEYGIDLDYLHQ